MGRTQDHKPENRTSETTLLHLEVPLLAASENKGARHQTDYSQGASCNQSLIFSAIILRHYFFFVNRVFNLDFTFQSQFTLNSILYWCQVFNIVVRQSHFTECFPPIFPVPTWHQHIAITILSFNPSRSRNLEYLPYLAMVLCTFLIFGSSSKLLICPHSRKHGVTPSPSFPLQ